MGAAGIDEEKPLGPQVEEKHALFKAYTKDETVALQAALLDVFELFCVKQCRDGLENFGPVLKTLWERAIIEEEVIMAWHLNERALCKGFPKYFDQSDAEAIRESSREFIEWVQAGED